MRKNLDDFYSIGINLGGYQKRSVQDCLNCEKDECDGCRNVDKKRQSSREYYFTQKERKMVLGTCVYCGGRSVSISCKEFDGGLVLRKKQCKKCKQIFRTAEMPVDEATYKKIKEENEEKWGIIRKL